MTLPTGKRVLSAVQPTGEPHVGNYLGALKQWVALQEAGNDCVFPIVDLHAVTAPYDVPSFAETVLKTAALYLAVGIDPKKSVLFVQSHVPAHAEAAWLLTTITPYGDLTRMTQFKEKGAKPARSAAHSVAGGQKTIGAGLFAYPVLMAADILLYRTDLVPVGEDQVQHLEFARTLARRFNRLFGDTLVEPRAYVLKETARVMSLTDPTRKMSKSDPPASSLALWDSPWVIRKKIRSAVTDSGTAVNPKKLGPALKNLLDIFAAFSARPLPEIAEEYSGRGYSAFKEALADLLVDRLAPLKARAEGFLRDRNELQDVLAKGAARAASIANPTLATMKERMGLLAPT